MNDQFLSDVLSGLSSNPKKLSSKYFYDSKGDALFQKIMHTEAYYLTRCEQEIFEQRSQEIAGRLIYDLDTFDLLELGAGDASKTRLLLQELLDQKAEFTYMPIDISSSMINFLERDLPTKVPGLKLVGLCGEYFQMLNKVKSQAHRRKVVLFLGGNIGNMDLQEARLFCHDLHSSLNKGDYVLIGFDLRKNPHAIFKAYNDDEGLTKAFNLNLLTRINTELGADIQLGKFEHYNSYDPSTGACKSYLYSMEAQQFSVADNTFQLAEHEVIDMEISQKYSLEEINELGNESNFGVVETYFDTKRWFLDILWQVN